jgi:hypothetical protein
MIGKHPGTAGDLQQVAEKVVFVVFAVIPAKAGIQYFHGLLDSRLRGSDDRIVSFSTLLEGGSGRQANPVPA